MRAPIDKSKYKININELKQARERLLKMEPTTETIREIAFLSSFIDDVDLVKNITSNKNKIFQTNFRNDFITLINDYYDYLKYIFEFYDSVDNDPEYMKYEHIVTSYDEVLANVHDFFKDLDDEWFKLFLNIYKKRYNSVRFSHDRSYSILFPKSDIWIANLQSNLTIEDYVYSTHEFAHGIESQIDPRVKSYAPENIFIEMFPILCQLLFLDTNDTLQQSEINKAINNYRKLMVDFAEETKFKFNISNKLGSYMNSPKNASKIIKRVFGQTLSKNEIASIYSNHVEENIVYIFPFLVACELVDLYHLDKDLFKYKVNKILTSNHEPLKLLEELDIEPNKILKK